MVSEDDRRALGARKPRPLAKATALKRQEFAVVGWSDPEGSRTHLVVLLYTDDGKLIYTGRWAQAICGAALSR